MISEKDLILAQLILDSISDDLHGALSYLCCYNHIRSWCDGTSDPAEADKYGLQDIVRYGISEETHDLILAECAEAHGVSESTE